jgi:hypothetical protein
MARCEICGVFIDTSHNLGEHNYLKHVAACRRRGGRIDLRLVRRRSRSVQISAKQIALDWV